MHTCTITQVPLISLCSVPSFMEFQFASYSPLRTPLLDPCTLCSYSQSLRYHVISNHSPRVQKIGNQLDYLGIVILMWGSTIPSIYYGLYCDWQLQLIYWLIVSVLATLCIVFTLHSGFRHPTFRPYRAAMYAGLGMSAVGFVCHGLSKYGWETQNQRMSLDWMALMAITNLAGAITYGTRVSFEEQRRARKRNDTDTCQYPEKLHPYVYDIYGSSHQILHIAVIFAGLAHMCGLFRAFKHIHTNSVVCA